MNENLKYIFSNINEWLKFAEAKVAGLLILNVGLIGGILQAHAIFNGHIQGFDGYIIALFCISCSICLYSILPVLNKWFRFYKKMDDVEFQSNKSNLNHLYYGDITKLSVAQYRELFNLKHSVNVSSGSGDCDLINQILNNAEIAWQKYVLFKVSCWLTFAGFICGVLLILIKTV